MNWLWNCCSFCGKRIETGEKCYGLPNGESVCTDCCVAENEGAAAAEKEKLEVHGKWIHLGGDEWCCSACGFVITTEGSWDKPTKKYCEDCGARMDGDSDALD